MTVSSVRSKILRTLATPGAWQHDIGHWADWRNTGLMWLFNIAAWKPTAFCCLTCSPLLSVWPLVLSVDRRVSGLCLAGAGAINGPLRSGWNNYRPRTMAAALHGLKFSVKRRRRGAEWRVWEQVAAGPTESGLPGVTRPRSPAVMVTRSR